MTVAALAQGDTGSLAYAAPVAAVAGFLFWRNLRDPEVTRANGLRAQVSFRYQSAAGLRGPGTFARVQTYPGAWDVVLDRMPERGDLTMLDVPQRGWVWLGSDGLPEAVKIRYARHWKTWRVTGAARDDTGEARVGRARGGQAKGRTR